MHNGLHICDWLAGILAGMWPCGIVTLISELFLAESKSQVYGHLHQFLQSVPTIATNLSKSIHLCHQLCLPYCKYFQYFQ